MVSREIMKSIEWMLDGRRVLISGCLDDGVNQKVREDPCLVYVIIVLLNRWSC
jgi:hypothetical protein